MTVGHVGVGRGEEAHNGARRLILGDTRIRQRDRGRRFVHVTDGDREHLVQEQARLVGSAEPNRVAGFRFAIENGRGFQLVPLDHKQAVVRVAWPFDETIGMRVVEIGIGRGQRSDNRADRLVFGQGRRRQLERRGRLILWQRRNVGGRETDNLAENVAGIQRAETLATRDVADQRRRRWPGTACETGTSCGSRLVYRQAGVESYTDACHEPGIFGVVAPIGIGIPRKRDDMNGTVAGCLHGAGVDLQIRQAEDLCGTVRCTAWEWRPSGERGPGFRWAAVPARRIRRSLPPPCRSCLRPDCRRERSGPRSRR